MVMSSTTIRFDDRKLFGSGQHTVQALSWRRESMERGFAGLDGVVSVDLGLRGRKLKQYGYLTAGSITSLIGLIEEISAYINGQAYDLVDQNGVSYPNVRMDSFTLLGPITGGNQACCEYEIVYTQLNS